MGRFSLGRTLTTPGVLQALADSGEHPAHFLSRHGACDWGEVDAEDRAANDLALTTGGRLLSVYRTSAGAKLWIITEADRSATTLLLPEDY
jgi:hypothetical protein